MLYVNVYHVTQLYGGPEEGGWYYDAGEPVGSTPIKTKCEPGKSYYLTSETEGHGRRAKVTKVTIHTRECDQCKGTGKYEKETEEHETPPGEEPAVYEVHCEYCGELPEDLEATARLIEQMYAMFDEEGICGRYEHISVSLQDHFATPYPQRKPHYE